MNFPATTSTQSQHVISHAGAVYTDWTVDRIEYIEGGSGWLSAVRDGEYLKTATLSNNTSGARRFAIVRIRQTASGLANGRSVIQACQ